MANEMSPKPAPAGVVNEADEACQEETFVVDRRVTQHPAQELARKLRQCGVSSIPVSHLQEKRIGRR